jgi:anaerobic ribonucleoside-triphosphate reductase activating protein
LLRSVIFLAKAMLQIGGFVPLTTQDFPNKLASVVFIRGCPWRCGYCHNPHLQSRDASQSDIRWESVLTFLKRRQGLLDAVMFSGGEPTIDSALSSAIDEVRKLGFLVGLHTAGCYPDRLRQIIDRLDWVGLDIKADLFHYDTITKVPNSVQKAIESLDILLLSGVDFECRTTISPDWLSEAQLEELASQLYQKGVKKLILQPYRSFTNQGLTLDHHLPSDYPSAAFITKWQLLFDEFFIRQ